MMNLNQAMNYGKKIGVKYIIKNSYGGTLGGAVHKADAEKMRDEFQKEYDNDTCNKGTKIFIVEV